MEQDHDELILQVKNKEEMAEEEYVSAQFFSKCEITW